MTGEEAKIEPRIVYNSTLTASGEIIDDLTGNTGKSDFENKVISYCEDRINIYSEPDETSDIVGCMYSRSQADIIENGLRFHPAMLSAMPRIPTCYSVRKPTR